MQMILMRDQYFVQMGIILIKIKPSTTGCRSNGTEETL